MDAALAPLRIQGIRILNLFDDCLILAQSEEMTVQHRCSQPSEVLGSNPSTT